MTGLTSTRWVSRHDFSWSVPLLTFERRKLDLLAWLEENSEPVSMLSTDDYFGVGFVDRTRIVARRDGLVIELLDPESSAPATSLFEAVCDVMGAAHVSQASLSGVWATPLPGWLYEDACRAFGTLSTGDVLTQSGVTPVDSAVLFDAAVLADHGGGRLQVEYGVVRPEELKMRMREPNVGRIVDGPMSSRPPLAIRDGDLPEVSLFADMLWTPAPSEIQAGEISTSCQRSEEFLASVAVLLANAPELADREVEHQQKF